MSTLEHVTAGAVWGSLLGAAFLCAFSCVQAVADRPRRRPFAFFALLAGATAALDFARPHLSLRAYEAMRLVVWSYYGASVAWLHGHGARVVLAAALVPGAIGSAVWLAGHPDLATTATLPSSFAIAALAHAVSWVRARGYGSAVLAATTTSMALACASYYAVVATSDATVIALGYAHWTFLNVIAVVFGWVHLPRELRGQMPVRVEPAVAVAAFVAILLGEVGTVSACARQFTGDERFESIALFDVCCMSGVGMADLLASALKSLTAGGILIVSAHTNGARCPNPYSVEGLVALLATLGADLLPGGLMDLEGGAGYMVALRRR